MTTCDRYVSVGRLTCPCPNEALASFEEPLPDDPEFSTRRRYLCREHLSEWAGFVFPEDGGRP